LNKVFFLSILATSIVAVLFIPIIPIDETYTITESYNRSLRYKCISAEVDDQRGFEECFHIWEIILQNLDAVGGTFTVTYKWRESWRPFTSAYQKWVTRNESQYLEPGETGTFRWEFRHKSFEPVVPRSSLQYYVTAPVVADTRAVTRHKTHYRSIIGILTGWV